MVAVMCVAALGATDPASAPIAGAVAVVGVTAPLASAAAAPAAHELRSWQAADYIVAFHEHSPQHGHAATVRQVLASTSGDAVSWDGCEATADAGGPDMDIGDCDVTWAVIPRANAAAQFPSDFALVRVRWLRDAARDAVLDALVAASVVKYVVKDQAVQLQPQSAVGPRAGADDDDTDDGEAAAAHAHAAPVGGPTMRRVFRWNNRFSFAESGAGVGDATKRRVTSRWTPGASIGAEAAGAWASDPLSDWERSGGMIGGALRGAEHEDGDSGGASDGDGGAFPGTFQELLPGAGALAESSSPSARRSASTRRLSSVTDSQNAATLWDKGFTGHGVKVAIFDTGLRHSHPHFRKVRERTNWTNERTLDDGVGHGTFVAGIVAADSECPGFAPDAELYVFRVFTNEQVSYTSWFLDAFNYALYRRVNVLNLSIGGPDYNDRPFVDKVHELTANGIIVVSAVGNDGPFYGTQNNPADQPDVIGVGGATKNGHIAAFSSRGMTTWELPRGYGRMKPDVVTLAEHLRSSRRQTGCRSLSGTSVASPVVAGAVALLSSVVPEPQRWSLLNPASMKQALVESATRLTEPATAQDAAPNVFEQGAGHLNLLGAFEVLSSYTPRVTALPAALDFTDCPYMWPYCEQPLFATRAPLVANITILNGVGVASRVVGEPVWTPGPGGEVLRVSASFSEHVWPWTGFAAISVGVVESLPGGVDVDAWSGTAEGTLSFVVETTGAPLSLRASTIVLPVKANVIPRPPRHSRVLWDQFHSINYPSGYVPRDNLDIKSDVLDARGDHPHTNARRLFAHLRKAGYHVELLGSDWTCFNASHYGTLLVADPEEEYFPAEIDKLFEDVSKRGLSLVLLADWYDTEVMDRFKFRDENTRSWWTPITGGANVPALNDVLQRFGAALGDRVYSGSVAVGSRLFSQTARFASGTSIARFPAGGYLSMHSLTDQSSEIVGDRAMGETIVPVTGLIAMPSPGPGASGGRVAVHGDSDCVFANSVDDNCWWLVDRLMTFAAMGEVPADLFPATSRLDAPFESRDVCEWSALV